MDISKFESLTIESVQRNPTRSQAKTIASTTDIIKILFFICLGALIARHFASPRSAHFTITEMTDRPFNQFRNCDSAGNLVCCTGNKSWPLVFFVDSTVDHNQAFASANNQHFVRELKLNHNICRLKTDDKGEISSTLPKYISNISLLVFRGHGSFQGIQLGDNAYITMNDDLSFLRDLNHNATILLYSCSTGKGGLEAKNFANFLTNYTTPGVRVFSATEILSWIRILPKTKELPYNFKLLGNLGANDVTQYKVQLKN